MAFTGSFICTAFYTDLLNGVHNFSAHTLRLALYSSSATLTAATTAYTTSNELAAALGYATGGAAVAPTVTTTTTATGTPAVIVDFADGTWAAATFTARGALLYNDTPAGNNAIAVLDFGSDRTGSGGTFTVVMPSPSVNAGFIVLTSQLAG